ncbi:zinc finger CCCH domain-containing protein 6-like [Vigna umbellata]|uniref:zinc finger CCCH domain-containing protein 6-like n=1 Tax=Vigna umbellata TaxID=87088 RepID=UPI001F5EAE02|nr:zinc finger CCCH domain-containing protein 6-like [Vigna umbellata]
MQQARKLKTVSWAPQSRLCQVKIFSSEESPSKIGNKSEDDFQAKTLSTRPSTLENDDFPPGFEGNHFQNQSKSEFSYIKWESPPPLVLNRCWSVAAGEESTEKYDEMLRERRVSEAYYPCSSAIPPSPFVSFNVENESYDDSLTPIISLIPIEEYESVTGINHDVSVTKKHGDSLSKLQTQTTQQCIQPATSSEANLVAASITTVSSTILKSIEEGTVIDVDFLFKIANDPIMIEKIIEEYSTVTTTGMNTASRTVSARKSSAPSNPLMIVAPEMSEIPSSSLLEPAHDNHITATPLVPLSGSVSAHTAAPHVKDVNYYKNLVRKYDGMSQPDKQNHNHLQNYKRPRVLNPNEVKRKIQKSCKYSKTSRGRRGSKCRYLHDKVWKM